MNRFLVAATALAAFLAALAGILDRTLYAGLFPPAFLPGAFPQDLLTLGVALALPIVGWGAAPGRPVRSALTLGLLGALFYLYGIFTIERVYNQYYLLYAAVFALSFWSLVRLVGALRPGEELASRWHRPTVVAGASAALLIAALFTFLWIMALLPLMQTRQRIEYLYSIYILDLCFVMPAFAVTALMALRRRPLGMVLAPAMMVTGFFVIFPLALNEWAKPGAGQATDGGSLAMSLVLSALMAALAALAMFRLGRPSPAGASPRA